MDTFAPKPGCSRRTARPSASWPGLKDEPHRLRKAGRCSPWTSTPGQVGWRISACIPACVQGHEIALSRPVWRRLDHAPVMYCAFRAHFPGGRVSVVGDVGLGSENHNCRRLSESWRDEVRTHLYRRLLPRSIGNGVSQRRIPVLTHLRKASLQSAAESRSTCRGRTAAPVRTDWTELEARIDLELRSGCKSSARSGDRPRRPVAKKLYGLASTYRRFGRRPAWRASVARACASSTVFRHEHREDWTRPQDCMLAHQVGRTDHRHRAMDGPEALRMQSTLVWEQRVRRTPLAEGPGSRSHPSAFIM